MPAGRCHEKIPRGLASGILHTQAPSRPQHPPRVPMIVASTAKYPELQGKPRLICRASRQFVLPASWDGMVG